MRDFVSLSLQVLQVIPEASALLLLVSRGLGGTEFGQLGNGFRSTSPKLRELPDRN